MSLIEWRDDFSVGDAGVDLEHREMIDLINKLHDSMGQGATADDVIEMLGEVYARIASHFALEEKLMRDTRYLAYASHKDSHEELLDELRDIMDRIHNEDRYDENALAHELDRWFTEHFRTYDAHLHKHLAEPPQHL